MLDKPIKLFDDEIVLSVCAFTQKARYVAIHAYSHFDLWLISLNPIGDTLSPHGRDVSPFFYGDISCLINQIANTLT